MSQQEQHSEQKFSLEAIDWVEKQANENLRDRVKNAEELAKESNLTLTVLLAGMGGALAYSVRLIEIRGDVSLLAGISCLGFYLMVLSGITVWKCMLLANIPSVGNEPENLQYGETNLVMLRRMELRGIQLRITDACIRNHTTADWINRIRLASALSPLVFILSALVALWLVRAG